MSKLHDHISPEYLPAEWGGKQPEYNAKAITKLVKENENKLIGEYTSSRKITSSNFSAARRLSMIDTCVNI